MSHDDARRRNSKGTAPLQAGSYSHYFVGVMRAAQRHGNKKEAVVLAMPRPFA